MITCKNIGYCRGYSREDHLLDDGPLRNLIGEEFKNLAALRRRAAAISRRQDTSSPIWYVVIFADGSTVEINP